LTAESEESDGDCSEVEVEMMMMKKKKMMNVMKMKVGQMMFGWFHEIGTTAMKMLMMMTETWPRTALADSMMPIRSTKLPEQTHSHVTACGWNIDDVLHCRRHWNHTPPHNLHNRRADDEHSSHSQLIRMHRHHDPGTDGHVVADDACDLRLRNLASGFQPDHQSALDHRHDDQILHQLRISYHRNGVSVLSW
jgi:hypothetical protein